jgi:hypothetical protein
MVVILRGGRIPENPTTHREWLREIVEKCNRVTATTHALCWRRRCACEKFGIDRHNWRRTRFVAYHARNPGRLVALSTAKEKTPGDIHEVVSGWVVHSLRPFRKSGLASY